MRSFIGKSVQLKVHSKHENYKHESRKRCKLLRFGHSNEENLEQFLVLKLNLALDEILKMFVYFNFN